MHEDGRAIATGSAANPARPPDERPRTRRRPATRLMFFRPTLEQGGADRVTLTLLEHLDRERFDLSLALARANGDLIGAIPSDVRVIDLECARLARSLGALVRLIRTERPDILFSTSSAGNIVAATAHLLARAPGRLVLSERSTLMRDVLTVRRSIRIVAKALTYRAADGVTCVSDGVGRDLARLLRLPRSRIHTVTNPVVGEDLGRNAGHPVRHPWFHDDVPIVLSAGRLVPEKSFDTLLRAFAGVRAERRARLVILGEGPLRARLLGLAAELGVREDFWMPGFDPNPFRYMARCTVFVLSSKHEGLPGVLIQAMACGAPVVSTDCHAGPSEIITEGHDGYLVPVGDHAALGDRIRRLLQDNALRARMAERAAATAARYRVEPVVERYTKVLLNTMDT